MGIFSVITSKISNVIGKSGNVSLMSLDYKSPSGGYLNYALFSVTGVNPETKRKNTRKYKCKYETEARELASADGLIDISNVVAIPFEPPTDRQLKACKEHHRSIPPGACSVDVSFLMTKEIEREDDASIDLIRQADSMGIKFSYLTGKQTLEELIKENK